MAPGSTNPKASSRKTKSSGTPSTAKRAVKKKPIEKNEKERIHYESSGVVSMEAVETPQTPAPSEGAEVRSELKKTKGKKRKKDSEDNKQPITQPETLVTNSGAQTEKVPAALPKEGPKLNARKLEMSLRTPGLRLVNNELQKVDDPFAKLSKQERKLLVGISAKKKSHAAKEPGKLTKRSDVDSNELQKVDDPSAKLSKQERKLPQKRKIHVAKESKEIDVGGGVGSLPLYRLSHFGGGRFLPIEPVFSRDEQFVI